MAAVGDSSNGRPLGRAAPERVTGVVVLAASTGRPSSFFRVKPRHRRTEQHVRVEGRSGLGEEIQARRVQQVGTLEACVLTTRR